MEENKKNERKKKRFAARFKSLKGIVCTDVPGLNIVLCNAGQATGLEKPTIISLVLDLRKDIIVPKFIAEKGESYSFLVFSKIGDSLLFYKTYNGKLKIDEGGALLYMSFVEQVPNTEIICHHENPNGLTLLEDFISVEEEQNFIDLFDWTDNTEFSLKNRQVKHYGYEFRYGYNDVDLSTPLLLKIPNKCDVLWKRLSKYGYDVGEPDQLTVNKYKPGQGIPSHVDRHSPFGDTILSLSLGSSVVMDWKHHTGKSVPVVVKARAMLIMQHEARYDWQHGIQPRTWDPVIETRNISSENGETTVKVITNDTSVRETRISLTFRWTQSGPCDCRYKTLCDSITKTSTENIGDDIASNLEELHVHQVYEQIAGHFSTTRHKPWPKVVQFMENVPAGAVVLDLGCGNGKNILKRNDILQLAGERSGALVAECARLVRDVPAAACVRLDVLHAPLRDHCADRVLCIAVIHHLSSQTRRIQAISNIARLLKPGGLALITVWAKDQTKSNYLCKTKQNKPQTKEQHITVAGVNLPVHENRTQFQHNDLLVPWKLRQINENKLADQPNSTLLRYYHVFEENELEDLCKKLPNLEVENSFYEEGNWCVICRKK